MKLFKRKAQIIRLRQISLGDEDIFDVSNLAMLMTNFRKVYETDDAFYAKSEDGIFRVRKPNFTPDIRKVIAVGDPGYARVLLDREGIEKLAMDYNAEILETDEAYFMLTTGLVFIATKEKGEG